MNEQVPEIGSKPMSKYARKVAERESGVRPQFQFVDGNPSRPQNPYPLHTPHGKGPSTILRTTVVKVVQNKGCLFLETESGQTVFLGLNVLQRYHKGKPVSAGDVILGEIEPHPNGKGPRMRQITSVIIKQND